ncbi:hypothetical protein TRVA0_029S01376 [Trichomonascus vanleenenianus]|uniref:cytochrome P450 n=1 Tax=Trichomonascus vanleenenianus TaxID=2268995 RepID=UPI003EC9E3CF
MLLDILKSSFDYPVTLAVTGIVTYFILYPLFFGKLKNVPGPWIAQFSSAWILYKTWSEQRIRLVDDLHRKYGPVVRLSPNEISVSDPTFVRTIYVGNYDKSTFYAQFGAYGSINMFATLVKDRHIKRRKVMTQAYSKSTVCSSTVEAMTQKRISNAVACIAKERELSKNDVVDVYNIFHALAMDTVTSFLLGEGNGTNYLETHNWSMIVHYRLQSAMWFWTTLMPRFYSWALDKETKIAVTTTAAWTKARTLARLSEPLQPGTVLEQLDTSGVTGLHAAAEVQDHTAAGHETTGVTLSYLTYHLSLFPEIQQRLQEELVETFGSPSKMEHETIPYKVVDSLPYLNGVVMETLRLYSAIPGAEPRTVPPTGMPVHSLNITIPGGTIVSMQPYTMHRDQNVFPDPYAFKPERWFESSPEQLRMMNKSFMAFGAGVRMCVGLNLALQEIKLITASIYRLYSTSIAPGFNDEDMVFADKYTTHPVGHKCPLIFEERQLA